MVLAYQMAVGNVFGLPNGESSLKSLNVMIVALSWKEVLFWTRFYIRTKYIQYNMNNILFKAHPYRIPNTGIS